MAKLPWCGLAALTLAGCVPPASLFMLSDGRVPSLGEHDLMVAAGAGGLFSTPTSDEDDGLGGPSFGAGLGYTAGLGRRVALSLGGAVMGGGPYATGQADVQVRLTPDPDAPVQVLFTGGLGGYAVLGDSPNMGVGLRAGVLISGAVHPKVRLYGGARLDTTWASAGFAPSPDNNNDGVPDERHASWSTTPAVSLNTALGSAFQVAERGTLGLEFASTPVLADPTFGALGGAVWFRWRFGEARDGAVSGAGAGSTRASAPGRTPPRP